MRLIVGVDHQHATAVARGGESEVQRSHAAPGGVAGADEGYHRHRLAVSAAGRRGAHVAQGIEQSR